MSYKLDGEGRPVYSNLPTKETSIFTGAEEREVEGIMLLADFIRTEGRAFEPIVGFCRSREEYALMQGLIQSQLNGIDEQRGNTRRLRGYYDTLTNVLNEEFTPVPSFNLHCRFERHAISNNGEGIKQKALLKSSMKECFVKGETNIAFFEDPYGQFKDTRIWSQVLGQKNSFIRAYICHKNGVNIPESVYKQYFNREQGQVYGINGDAMERYIWMTLEILDELQNEGYSISYLFEDAIKREVPRYKPGLENFKATTMFVVNGSLGRNKRMARQILELEERSKKGKTKTNLFFLLGTQHSVIMNILPARLRFNSVVRVEHLIEGPVDIIVNKLLNGVDPSEDEWRKALATVKV